MEYQERLRELGAGWARVRGEHASAFGIVAVLGVGIFALIPYARRLGLMPWWLGLAIPVVAVGVIRFRRYQAARSRAWRLKVYYERGVQRAAGEWAGKGFDEAEFLPDGHPYGRDLGVFGEGSLFELMCIARTGIGRRRLAGYLLAAVSIDEIRLRQRAVAELAPRRELREEVAVLGEYESAESRWETFAQWLDAPEVAVPRGLQRAARVNSVLLIAVVLLTLATAGTGMLPWIRMAMWAWPLVLFHAAVGAAYRRRVNGMAEALRSLSVETRVVREGLQLLATQRFESVLLAGLAERVRHGAGELRKLERMLGALNQRDKDGYYFPSRVLLVGTQLYFAIEEWRARRGAALRDWVEAWGEFEALNALGNYADENGDHTFPDFAAEGACFEAEGLGHPLLANEGCVRNDVRLNAEAQFYVISGSNMSGKSTLMRSIGLNAVLAFAGAPVRARGLRLSALSVCASIAVVDSLMNGKSKFLAEVERLRETIEAAAKGPVLFLVDEILSGTNSRDRRAAAEAVVRVLVGRGAIGALSTHDMALTEIAEIGGANVHMGSMAGGGPMDFDYLLKAGPTTETNALEIARMAGVPV